MELVPGEEVEVIVAAKGGGSENKTKFAMLLPTDSIVDWVLATVPTMGADWCPPGMLVARHRRLAREGDADGQVGLMEPIDMPELQGARAEVAPRSCASSSTRR